MASHYRTVTLPVDLRQELAAGFDKAAEDHQNQDASHKVHLRKRLAELDRQEDRYIELAADPDWPKAKLTQKLRDIRDERARLEGRLNQTTAQLDQGQANARLLLDYPYELYLGSEVQDRTKLNRLLFKKVKIDVTEGHNPQVTSDEMLEPFASVVYFRRQHETPTDSGLGTVYLREAGGAPLRSPACDNHLLSLLERALSGEPLKGSSKNTMAEDRGFEPLRALTQHAFQACALGHYANPPSKRIRVGSGRRAEWVAVSAAGRETAPAAHRTAGSAAARRRPGCGMPARSTAWPAAARRAPTSRPLRPDPSHRAR